jgi:hypothetical protein
MNNALKAVRSHRDHPAILMWSIWNDAPWVWGAVGNPFESFSEETINSFLKEIYDAVKKEDPSHPVTASNVLNFKGSSVGSDFLDVLGYNAYLGGLDWYVQEDADNDLKKMKDLGNDLNKPIVILETGFSTFVKGLDQGEVFKKQFETIGKNLAGVTIFQWADGWAKTGYPSKQDEDIEEHWGVVDGFRHPKPSLEVLSKIYNSIDVHSEGYRYDVRDAIKD